jgi:hypothetical protein
MQSQYTDPKDFPVFGVLDKASYIAKRSDLLRAVLHVSRELGIDRHTVRYSLDRIDNIVDLVQRRRVYFHVFHGGMDMGELNEACLICFWILKLNPFQDATDPNHNVNLIFALALFTRAINYTAEKRGHEPNLTENTVSHLIHAFIYRDLSKEAIMAIAESLIG